MLEIKEFSIIVLSFFRICFIYMYVRIIKNKVNKIMRK